MQKEDTSTQHDNQTTSSNNHATQANGTKPSEEAMKNDDMSKKTMKRIQPEKIAEVGEWKAEKAGEEADEEDNAQMSIDGPEST